MGYVKMKSKDTLAATEAKCFVIIDGKRYNFMNAIKFEAKMKKKKSKVPILGKPGGGNRSVGWEGTGSMTVHYNSSVMRKMELAYMKTGKDFYFDIIVTNEDKTNSLGRQTIKYLDCNTDESILSKFDSSASDTLQETFNFTFEGAEMTEEFEKMLGFEV